MLRFPTAGPAVVGAFLVGGAPMLVTPEKVAESVVCGDPDRFVDAITAFADAGYDYLYIQQIGPDQSGFLDFIEREVRKRL